MECATIENIHPLFGIEVTGLSLVSLFDPPESSECICKPDLKTTIEKVKLLVHKHKVVVFRDQGILTGEEQIQISRWFGEMEDAGFEQHPKSPHRLILRVSNDENEGFREFGTSGFHIDGSFMEYPNDFSIYHITKVPDRGTTGYYQLLNSLLTI